MDKQKDRLPDFIIVGAAKSGTTSLYQYLMQHPNIFLSVPKEPCFFDENVSWNKGVKWYKSLFSEATENQLCGEASTNYTRWPQVLDVPKKIHNLIPNVKIIYIMRSPANRSYSHYVHRWTKEVHLGEPFSKSFFEYVESDPMCIDSSMYYEQLEKYLEYFPKEQILPIIFEDLLELPKEVIDQLFTFLELQPSVAVNYGIPLNNENKSFRYHVVRNAFIDRFKKIPGAIAFLNVIPTNLKAFIYNKILMKSPKARAFRNLYEPKPLSDEETSKLKNIFVESNANLAKKWKLDLKNKWDDF